MFDSVNVTRNERAYNHSPPDDSRSKSWILYSQILQARVCDTVFLAPRSLIDSALDRRSLRSELESRRGHIWKVSHLWVRFITFEGSSAYLAYHVHKSGRKTSIIIITIIYPVNQTLWRWWARLQYKLRSPILLGNTSTADYSCSEDSKTHSTPTKEHSHC